MFKDEYSAGIWLCSANDADESQLMAFVGWDFVLRHIDRYSKPGFIVTQSAKLVEIINIDAPDRRIVMERVA